MSRIRTIKPEFFDDPDIGDLSPWARLLFIGLWTQSDRDGRVVADWRRLRARIFPYDAKCPDLSRLAVELHGKDMIRSYRDSLGRECLWIVNFLTHQRPHPKEPASIIEPWPGVSIQAENIKAVEENVEPCKETVDRVDYGLLTMDQGKGMDHRVPTPTALTADDGFEAFWKVYPKKVGKGAAQKVWRTLRPGSELQATIGAAVAAQRQCRQWLNDAGKYIPNPATWLGQKRWDDEPDPVLSDSAPAQHVDTLEDLEAYRLRKATRGF